jgi:guanyl-specific ribonuclease Sa
MSRTSTILERLRWKVGLALVVLAAAGAAHAAPAADHPSSATARSSWGEMEMARSSWSDMELIAKADPAQSELRSSWS